MDEEESGCDDAAGTEDADSHADEGSHKHPRRNHHSATAADVDDYDLVACLRQLRDGAPRRS